MKISRHGNVCQNIVCQTLQAHFGLFWYMSRLAKISLDFFFSVPSVLVFLVISMFKGGGRRCGGNILHSSLEGYSLGSFEKTMATDTGNSNYM